MKNTNCIEIELVYGGTVCVCNEGIAGEWRPFEYGGLFNENNCRESCCNKDNGQTWKYYGFAGKQYSGDC